MKQANAPVETYHDTRTRGKMACINKQYMGGMPSYAFYAPGIYIYIYILPVGDLPSMIGFSRLRFHQLQPART